MSDVPSSSQSVSPVEINGRLAEIATQRDMAQNRCIVLAGRVAELVDVIRAQQSEIKLLKGETQDEASEASSAA